VNFKDQRESRHFIDHTNLLNRRPLAPRTPEEWAAYQELQRRFAEVSGNGEVPTLGEIMFGAQWNPYGRPQR
jgi:hypothetical protein